MANVPHKFKNGVEVTGTASVNSDTVTTNTATQTLTNKTIDSASNTLTGVELLANKDQANGYAGLDANGKLLSSVVPAIAITEVFTAADITARDALTIGSGDGEVQEGDVVRVTDASADPNITSGAASYIYDGSAYVLLKAGDEVLSVNGQTGIVTLDADDVSAANQQLSNLSATAVDVALTSSNQSNLGASGSPWGSLFVNQIRSGTDVAVLNANSRTLHSQFGTAVLNFTNGVEVSAEITPNADNSRSIGTTALNFQDVHTRFLRSNGLLTIDTLDNSDADANPTSNILINTGDKTAGTGDSGDVTLQSGTSAGGTRGDIVLDGNEIDASTSKIVNVVDPTADQDAATKKYVDDEIAAVDTGASAGDISETTFAMANNVAAPTDVTGFAFANATVRSFEALVSVEKDATADSFEVFTLRGVQKGADWDMSVSATGDNSGVNFSITSAGQIQYTSNDEAGFVSGDIKFRAITTTV